MKVDVFGDHLVGRLGGIPVTDTMVTSASVSLLLVAALLVLRGAARRAPRGRAAAAEIVLVEWLDGLVAGIVDRPVPWLATFSGSLFLFIAANAVAGQLPHVRPATASLCTTSALAVVVLLAVPVVGVGTHGARYFRRYLQPNPLLFPLHLLSLVSRTLALSVRLFGNMMSGHLIVALLVSLVGVLVPMPLMALDLLIGGLQAYIFAILATVYVGAALRAGEEI